MLTLDSNSPLTGQSTPIIRSPMGRNNCVTVLMSVSLQEKVWPFLPGGQKKWP